MRYVMFAICKQTYFAAVTAYSFSFSLLFNALYLIKYAYTQRRDELISHFAIKYFVLFD